MKAPIARSPPARQQDAARHHRLARRPPGRARISIVDGSFYLPALKRDAKAEFIAGHIPGAVFFDIDAIADHSTELPHMLPGATQFAKEVGALGIGKDDTIVVYDGAGLGGAPRVWWTFRIFGARKSTSSMAACRSGRPKAVRSSTGDASARRASSKPS